MSGTEVTAREVGAASFTASSVTITDDYVLITDGRAYQAGVQVHKRPGGGWTHVITVKCDPVTPTPEPSPAPPGVDSEAVALTDWLTKQIGERERKAVRSSTEMARAHEAVAAFAREVRDRLATPTTGETR